MKETKSNMIFKLKESKNPIKISQQSFKDNIHNKMTNEKIKSTEINFTFQNKQSINNDEQKKIKIKSLILPNLTSDKFFDGKNSFKNVNNVSNNLNQINSSSTKFKTLETNSLKTVNIEYLETNDNTSFVKEVKKKNKTKIVTATPINTESKNVSRNNIVKDINCLFNLDSFSTDIDKINSKKRNKLLKPNQFEIDKNMLIKSIKSYKNNNYFRLNVKNKEEKEKEKEIEVSEDNSSNKLKHINVKLKTDIYSTTFNKNSYSKIENFFFKNSIKSLMKKKNDIEAEKIKIKNGIGKINLNIKSIIESYESNKLKEKSLSLDSSSNDSYLAEEVKDVVELEDIDVIKKRIEMKKKIINMYQSIEKVSNLENYSREYYKVPDLKNNLSLYNENTYSKTKQKLELSTRNITTSQLAKNDNPKNQNKINSQINDNNKELEYDLITNNNTSDVLQNNLTILQKFMEANLKDTEELKNYYGYFKYKTEFYDDIKFADDNEKDIINSI